MASDPVGFTIIIAAGEGSKATETRGKRVQDNRPCRGRIPQRPSRPRSAPSVCPKLCHSERSRGTCLNRTSLFQSILRLRSPMTISLDRILHLNSWRFVFISGSNILPESAHCVLRRKFWYFIFDFWSEFTASLCSVFSKLLTDRSTPTLFYPALLAPSQSTHIIWPKHDKMLKTSGEADPPEFLDRTRIRTDPAGKQDQPVF